MYGRGWTGRGGCSSNVDVNVGAVISDCCTIHVSGWLLLDFTGFTGVDAVDLLGRVDVTAGQCTEIPWNLPDNRPHDAVNVLCILPYASATGAIHR